MSYPLRQMTVTIGSPSTLNGREGRRELADFYGRLLGMGVIDERWLRIAKSPTSAFQIALDGDGWSDLRPPRWRDPEHPQQLHLDLCAPDPGATGALIVEMGGVLLEDFVEWQVFA